MSIYALFHLYIPLLLYLFICALCRFFSIPSLKYASFTQKKTASVTENLQTPYPASRAVYKRLSPTTSERPKKTPLKTNAFLKKWRTPKEFICPIRCCFGVHLKVFLGVFHPVLFLSIALISPYLYVFCSLETLKTPKVKHLAICLSCLQA